jgi:hypothetical protein
MKITLAPGVIQDGSDFILEETEEHGAQLLASYPALDAQAAREKFKEDFPNLVAE